MKKTKFSRAKLHKVLNQCDVVVDVMVEIAQQKNNNRLEQ